MEQLTCTTHHRENDDKEPAIGPPSPSPRQVSTSPASKERGSRTRLPWCRPWCDAMTTVNSGQKGGLTSWQNSIAQQTGEGRGAGHTSGGDESWVGGWREELRDDDERQRWGGGCSVTSALEWCRGVKPARVPPLLQFISRWGCKDLMKPTRSTPLSQLTQS
jgi:hypothetical protein